MKDSIIEIKGLKNCPYCNEYPIVYNFRDRNYLGEEGYKTVIRCKKNSCREVSYWHKIRITSLRKTMMFWGVVNDG